MWSGTYSQPGKVEGRFLGPVAGSCDGLDWTGAPVVGDIASITTSGDGSATVAGMTAAHPGCYTWSVAWTARENPLVQAVSPAGEQSETTLIVAPTIVTRTSASATTDPGVFRDTVSTAGTGDLSGSITGVLLGPVTPVDRSCVSVDWSGVQAAGAVDEIGTASDGESRRVMSRLPRRAATRGR